MRESIESDRIDFTMSPDQEHVLQVQIGTRLSFGSALTVVNPVAGLGLSGAPVVGNMIGAARKGGILRYLEGWSGGRIVDVLILRAYWCSQCGENRVKRALCGFRCSNCRTRYATIITRSGRWLRVVFAVLSTLVVFLGIFFLGTSWFWAVAGLMVVAWFVNVFGTEPGPLRAKGKADPRSDL